ncbi:RNA-binding protein [Rothia terrae]|nr:RNA-binding protein [Rothia terrae]
MGVAKFGLNHPADLSAWYEWQQQADAVRRVKGMASNMPVLVNGLLAGGLPEAETPEPATGIVHTSGNTPQILVVLESTSPTSVSSLVRPLEFLDGVEVAVWAPHDVSHVLPHGAWQTNTMSEHELENLTEISSVLSSGHYLPLGAAAYRFARARQAEFVVVQHGLMAPFAPPLPANSTLLAFSDEDALFWKSGRTDVQHRVVGSQLFYEAAQSAQQSVQQGDSTVHDNQIVFLGQMHGAELPRASFARAGFSFCRQNKARYRPHPSEKDKLSVLTHALWAKMGIAIDRSGQPLNTLNNPVVSVFSTGVLETAIRGVPAWVYHPHPPQWLQDFWQRYGMSRWGEEPTPAPPQPDIEPARAIAQYLKESLT